MIPRNHFNTQVCKDHKNFIEENQFRSFKNMSDLNELFVKEMNLLSQNYGNEPSFSAHVSNKNVIIACKLCKKSTFLLFKFRGESNAPTDITFFRKANGLRMHDKHLSF